MDTRICRQIEESGLENCPDQCRPSRLSVGCFFYLEIANGRNFLLSILLFTLGATLLLMAWVILVHGDLKQRTDGCVAIISSIALLALALAALCMYELDWNISATCLESPSDALCSDKIVMTQHNQNAATLQQIWSLLAFGQIIPLLSILKDTVYCWLKPTPWQEMSLGWSENRRIRRKNQRRSRHAPAPAHAEIETTAE